MRSLLNSHTIQPMKMTDAALRSALGQVLANVRESRDMRQGDVLDQTTVSKLESGVNFPSWPSFLQLCRKYRVSPTEVLSAAESLIENPGAAKVHALEPDEDALLTLYRACTAEGKRLLLDRAHAVHTLFPK